MTFAKHSYAKDSSECIANVSLSLGPFHLGMVFTNANIAGGVIHGISCNKIKTMEFVQLSYKDSD